MTLWPNRRLLDLLGIELPILQAPMAGAVTTDLTVAVAEAGGLGAVPCATRSLDQVRTELAVVRQRTEKPINLNFFCHTPAAVDAAGEAAWRQDLRRYYAELGLDPEAPAPTVNFAPFDAACCALVEELRPEIVSFHFGLPSPDLVTRVKAAGAKILSSATTVDEAVALEADGCDAIIAQGAEAGGHRAMFRTEDLTTQIGTMALVPQIVDAVKVPVVAAGGIADGRGIAAVFALGAAAAQIGTAYLFCPEASVSPLHRKALKAAAAGDTAITNVLTGRPARAIVNRLMRELGPLSESAPPFPLAAGALAPLRAAAEPKGSDDFTPLWSGAAASLGRELPAGALTRRLAEETLALMAGSARL
jgi:nitronate monooxygenase